MNESCRGTAAGGQGVPSPRRAEMAIAILFVVTALGAIIGGGMIDPLLTGPGFPGKIAAHPLTLANGAVLWTVNNIGIVFIAVFAYPILHRFDVTVAVGYLSMRIMEATVMTLGVIAILTLGHVAQSAASGGADSASLVGQGELLNQLRAFSMDTVMLPFLGFGGLLFSVALYRFHLVPRALAGFGVLGYALVFLGGIAGWYGLITTDLGEPGMFLAMPVALWEIILMPVWLLWRGFDLREAA